MSSSVLFLMGFTAIVSVYEIAKSGKRSSSQKLQRAVDASKKILK